MKMSKKLISKKKNTKKIENGKFPENFWMVVYHAIFSRLSSMVSLYAFN